MKTNQELFQDFCTKIMPSIGVVKVIELGTKKTLIEYNLVKRFEKYLEENKRGL